MRPAVSGFPRAAAMAAALLCVGCAGAAIEPPDGFVPVPDPAGKEYVAVSARGTALAVDRRPNEGGRYGTLRYWCDAFLQDKVRLGRYRLAKEEPIRTDVGRDGTLLELRTGQGAGEYVWLVALFADPAVICTVEAGGPSAQIEADRARIVASMRTLRY